MSTVTTWQINSTSSEQTEALAEQIGKQLKGGEVIELHSDVGGGKTTFVRGLVRGMGSSDHVASPTFTISREYQSGELRMYHFDFYRLHEPGIMAQELGEVCADPKAVVVVEWSDIVQHVLPEYRMTITLERTGESERLLTFLLPASMSYLLRELQN